MMDHLISQTKHTLNFLIIAIISVINRYWLINDKYRYNTYQICET